MQPYSQQFSNDIRHFKKEFPWPGQLDTVDTIKPLKNQLEETYSSLQYECTLLIWNYLGSQLKAMKSLLKECKDFV